MNAFWRMPRWWIPALSWSHAVLLLILLGNYSLLFIELMTERSPLPGNVSSFTLSFVLGLPLSLAILFPPIMLLFLSGMSWIGGVAEPEPPQLLVNAFTAGYFWLPVAINLLLIYVIVVSVTFGALAPASRVRAIEPSPGSDSYGPVIASTVPPHPDEVARSARHARVWGWVALVFAAVGLVITVLSVPVIASIPLLVAALQCAVFAFILGTEERLIPRIAIWLTVLSLLIFVIVVAVRFPYGEFLQISSEVG